MKPSADRSHLWLFWLLALIGLTADQASKYGVFTWLYADGPQETVTFAGLDVETDEHSYPGLVTRKWHLAPGVFSIEAAHTLHADDAAGPLSGLRTVSGPNRPHVNQGALFGIQPLAQHSNLIFAVVSFLAAVAIVWWSRRPGRLADRMLCTALGLILAGTLGNLYDRLVFDGVRDFLHWYKFFNWPVFNVADCCLVCGAGLLLVHAFLTAEEPTPAKQEAAAAAEPATVESAH